MVKQVDKRTNLKLFKIKIPGSPGDLQQMGWCDIVKAKGNPRSVRQPGINKLYRSMVTADAVDFASNPLIIKPVFNKDKNKWVLECWDGWHRKW